jgi:chorismate mutase
MKDISELRITIDAIDDKIIELFNERSSVVKNVGIFKKRNLATNECFIRSGREAEVVRRIYHKFKDGVFPAKFATDMWRMVICASLSLETELTISVYESDADMYWLVREYFGHFTPIAKRKESEDVIKDIVDGNAQVGVFPVTGEGWWIHLSDNIKIFACIPFVLQANEEVHALAVARLKPENTGDDVSLLKLTADVEIDWNKIHAVFHKYTMDFKLLSQIGNLGLIEVKGFIHEQDERLTKIVKETGFAIVVLGSYAVPLRV